MHGKIAQLRAEKHNQTAIKSNVPYGKYIIRTGVEVCAYSKKVKKGSVGLQLLSVTEHTLGYSRELEWSN